MDVTAALTAAAVSWLKAADTFTLDVAKDVDVVVVVVVRLATLEVVELVE